MSEATVIYDADCGFCKWCLAILLAWDGGGAKRGRPSPPNLQVRRGGSAAPGSLRPLALGTAEADRLLADLSEEERNASWHLVLSGDEATSAGTAVASRQFSAGAALAPALRLLPAGSFPAAVFARFPRATEAGYRWVAEHRGLLGRFVGDRARRWADRVIAAHLGSPQP